MTAAAPPATAAAGKLTARAYAARIRDEVAEMQARVGEERECEVLVHVPYQGLFVVGAAVLRKRKAGE